MEWVPCNLCGSTRQALVYEIPDRHYFPDEIFQVVECKECGLGFVNPRPAFEKMQKYYPPEYYEEEFVRNRDQHLRRYAAEAEYLREIETRGGPRSLLDIGCANGDFPRFMRARGWAVEGVEVSSSAQPIQDFPVFRLPFPEIPVDQPAYDGVTAWAVLEHVHDPKAYFQKASRVLKAGGLFVFLVTNFKSIASRRLFCEDVPRHLYFFTRETVEQYLEAAAFRLEKAHSGKDIYSMPPLNWLLYLIRTRLEGQTFSWRDVPLNRLEFIERNHLPAGWLSSLKFALANPVTTLDRAFLPVVEMVQILRGNYGISTFVARKL